MGKGGSSLLKTLQWKRIGVNLLRLEEAKLANVEKEVCLYNPSIDDSRVPVRTWDMTAWE